MAQYANDGYYDNHYQHQYQPALAQSPPMPPSHTPHQQYGYPNVAQNEHDAYGGGVGQAVGYRDDHAPRGSMSDVKLTGPYDYAEVDGSIRERRRPTCMDRICCGCCTCCPKWMRYCSCILLIIIICLGIVIGVLAGIFKTPTVSVGEVDTAPTVSLQGSVIDMNTTLDVSVNNPNVESVTFETIVAKIYYPGYSSLQLGQGQVNNIHINSYAITNFTFPLTITVNLTDPSYSGIAQDLFSKCGTSSSGSQITVDYDVIPTIRVIGIPISPTISSNTKVACPDLSGINLSSLSSLSSVISQYLPSATSAASSLSTSDLGGLLSTAEGILNQNQNS